MIIQCNKCGTRYRFDESQIDGEGIWVRCSHCKTVFFQDNPFVETFSLADSIEPVEEVYEKTHENSAVYTDSDVTNDEPEDDVKEIGQIEDYGDIDEIKNTVEASKEAQNPRTIGRKLLIFFILVLLLSGGFYLWTSSGTIEKVLNRVLPQVEQFVEALPGAEKFFGAKSSDIPEECLSGLGVDLTKVQERFVTNWVAGNIIVVEGVAVNTSKCAVSNITIRGKILDSSGNILAEEGSACGNILTDEELKGLTEEEIAKELSNAYGRDFSNADIKPGATIPFMLVFVMPADEAHEFIVELADIESTNMK